ncbi:hypothetical protein FOVSG1_005375 [Fusarium oxysporum f. sp. vasinfectum]
MHPSGIIDRTSGEAKQSNLTIVQNTVSPTLFHVNKSEFLQGPLVFQLNGLGRVDGPERSGQGIREWTFHRDYRSTINCIVKDHGCI